jgi:large subunit ribosomal protein L21
LEILLIFAALKKNYMYAIVDIAGQQFTVEKDQKIFVHRLGNVKVGAPVVAGAKVSATVISHLKGEKVIVFKKKRRKGYKVKNGHRQSFTKIQIEEIKG